MLEIEEISNEKDHDYFIHHRTLNIHHQLSGFIIKPKSYHKKLLFDI
jgi:hypothetical protein